MDAFTGLRNIHPPDALSFWPPAPGWWLLAALLLCWIAGRAFSRRSQRRNLRSEARAELGYIGSRYDTHRDPIDLAIDLSSLLRRVALARFGRDVVAALHGEAWIDFLVRTSGRDSDAFPCEVGGALTVALYSARPGGEIDSADGGEGWGPEGALPGLDCSAWIVAVHEWIGANT